MFAYGPINHISDPAITPKVLLFALQKRVNKLQSDKNKSLLFLNLYK